MYKKTWRGARHNKWTARILSRFRTPQQRRGIVADVSPTFTRLVPNVSFLVVEKTHVGQVACSMVPNTINELTEYYWRIPSSGYKTGSIPWTMIPIYWNISVTNTDYTSKYNTSTQCWTSVVNVGSTLNHHWLNILCLMRRDTLDQIYLNLQTLHPFIDEAKLLLTFLPNVGLMLGQRRWRWDTNITTVGFVFAGIDHLTNYAPNWWASDYVCNYLHDRYPWRRNPKIRIFSCHKEEKQQ